jgi:cell division septation protein DedD
MTAPESLNLTLLIKLLKMTTSNHDGEALTAMRKANEQLGKFGGDWEALIRGKVTIIADPFTSASPPPMPTQRQQHAAPPPPPPRPAQRQPVYTQPRTAPRPQPRPRAAAQTPTPKFKRGSVSLDDIS